jgi:hypothetical protein
MHKEITIKVEWREDYRDKRRKQLITITNTITIKVDKKKNSGQEEMHKEITIKVEWREDFRDKRRKHQITISSQSVQAKRGRSRYKKRKKATINRIEERTLHKEENSKINQSQTQSQ